MVANDTVIGYATPCAFIDLRSTDINAGGQTAFLKTNNCNLELTFFRLTNITGLNDGCPTEAFHVIGNDLGGNTNITFEVPPSGTLQFADTIVACQSLPHIFNPNVPGTPTSYQWFKNGVLDPSETGPTYAAFEAGSYKVVVTYTGVGCANAYEQRLFAVIDTIKPQIAQMSDTTIVNTAGVTIVFSGNSRDPQVTDNCFIHNIWYSLSGATVADSVKANTINGVIFNEGITTVTWHASDSILPTWYITTPSSTNTGTTSFDILVIGSKMKKKATLNGVMNTGSYANPVSVLFNEIIEYELTAVNESLTAGSLIVRDTLPPYLNYVANSATTAGAAFTTGQTGGTPSRDILTWSFANVSSQDTRIVEYEATPESGVCASQPMFINRASIVVGNTLSFMTNASFHQGAGV
ncbi:MAG: hypothetical protein LBV74_13505, partial [Tannerella sp.]|nr:hypothetical protein [Tannerella sp.]